jgi:hypothetical protein
MLAGIHGGREVRRAESGRGGQDHHVAIGG